VVAESAEPSSVHRSTRGGALSDDELLDAACRVFAEFGFMGTSMSALARSANSTKPTLYAHFGSKDQLYEACLRREADKLTSRLFATYEQAADLPLQQQIHADMRAFFDHAAAHSDGFRLLFDDQTRGNLGTIRAELLAAITDRVAGRIRNVITRNGGDTPTASAELLAAMVVGIAVHGARQALLLRPLDPAQAGDLASSLAHMGLRSIDLDLMKSLDEDAHE